MAKGHPVRPSETDARVLEAWKSMGEEEDENLAGDDEGADGPGIPTTLAEVVWAAASPAYSYMIRLDEQGNQSWPVAPVAMVAGLRVVAWPSAAGPQFGGVHYRVAVDAADVALVAEQMDLEPAAANLLRSTP